jgi:hypothetical protein
MLLLRDSTGDFCPMMVSEVYDALVAAGAPEDKARGAAIAVSEEQLVTKKDIADIKSGLIVVSLPTSTPLG